MFVYKHIFKLYFIKYETFNLINKINKDFQKSKFFLLNSSETEVYNELDVVGLNPILFPQCSGTKVTLNDI